MENSDKTSELTRERAGQPSNKCQTRDLNLLQNIKEDRTVAIDKELRFNTPFGPLILTFMILSQNYNLLAEKDGAIDYFEIDELIFLL